MFQDILNASTSCPRLNSAPPEPNDVSHKIPGGDTPYVRAKRVQLVDKDPERAIPMFWAAINAGDRVDDALKDMAIVMKQQNRAEEAIEAIRSLRHFCSDQARESLDDILLDLYKRCGRLDDQVALLRHKLCLIGKGLAFNGKQTKTALSQGRKFEVSLNQEATRLLGKLGCALMQQNKYSEAEEVYRRVLSMTPDSNKMCNLGICLMMQGKVVEAKETLCDLEMKEGCVYIFEKLPKLWSEFNLKNRRTDKWDDEFDDENFDSNMIVGKQRLGPLRDNYMFNIDAPFFSSKLVNDAGSLKRSWTVANLSNTDDDAVEAKTRRTSSSFSPWSVSSEDRWSGLLPDNKEFEDAIIQAALDYKFETDNEDVESFQSKNDKRLKVFREITLTSNVIS